MGYATPQLVDEPLEVTIEKAQEEAHPDKGMNKYPGPERHYDETDDEPFEAPNTMGEAVKGVAHYHKRP